MDALEQLKTEFEDLDRLVKIRAGEMARIENQVKALVNRFIDAPGADRDAILKERAELINYRDALREELRELERRRNVAYLAPFEYQVREAERELRERAAKEKEARIKLDAAKTKERIWSNGGLPDLSRDEIVEVQTVPARIQAENRFIVREVEQAKHALEVARAELEAAQEEISGKPGDLIKSRG